MFKQIQIIYVIAFISLFNSNYAFTHETTQNRLFIKYTILQQLEDGCYSPVCIQILSKAYPETTLDGQILDEVLIEHYYREAKKALAIRRTTLEKLSFLDQEILACILPPEAIARGQEGPLMAYPRDGFDDGSDHGIRWRRVKALRQLKNKIELNSIDRNHH